MRLHWHGYSYYPYERDLALREVHTLLTPTAVREEDGTLVVDRPLRTREAERLVYFASVTSTKGCQALLTQQGALERINGNGAGRQSTRYSVHGLHEYKGKFNPQVAKAILNIFGAKTGQHAIDPFCGSGTSLVECAQLGIRALGTDINPMAVFIANAKLQSLGVRAAELSGAAGKAIQIAKQSKRRSFNEGARGQYLSQWFTKEVHHEIERLRIAIDSVDAPADSVLFAIASNLLRDYSLQDPHDLRIRRRKSPLPAIPLLNAFDKAARSYCARLEDAQRTIGVQKPSARAIELDARTLRTEIPAGKFDVALTSPPYATALPYIDTQRLSLIWLGLIEPAFVPELESRLVGSRETRGQSKKRLLLALESNESMLPELEAGFCTKLQAALSELDGFRRQVVPSLLYRYFGQMKESFEEILPLMKPGAPFALIVGGNHTVLGGRRFDIDTPRHLTSLAVSAGWRHVETIPLQTYQRFGLHMVNSTNSEALLLLSA